MLQRWAGPIVVVLILGGVIAVLVLNLNLKGRNSADSTAGVTRSVPNRPASSRPTPAARGADASAGRFPRVPDRRRGREKRDADQGGLAAARSDGGHGQIRPRRT